MLISIRNYPVTEMIKSAEDLSREGPPHMRSNAMAGSAMNVEEFLSEIIHDFRSEAQKNTEETKSLMGQLIDVIRSNNELSKKNRISSRVKLYEKTI